MKIRFLETHTIRSTLYQAGEVLHLDAALAEYLIGRGFAIFEDSGEVVVDAPAAVEEVQVSQPSPTITTVPKHGKRGLNRR